AEGDAFGKVEGCDADRRPLRTGRRRKPDSNPRSPVARNGDPSESAPFAGSLRTDGLSQEKTARLTPSAVPVGYKADPFARGQKGRCGEATGFTAAPEQEIRRNRRSSIRVPLCWFRRGELGQVRRPCQCHYGRVPIGGVGADACPDLRRRGHRRLD